MLRSVAVLGLTCCAGLGQAQTLVYHETSGGKTEVHSYAITPREDGYLVVLDRRGEGIEIVDRCETDAQLSTLVWLHENGADKTRVTARREADIIRLSGLDRGQAIERTFRINGHPWKQLFSVDFSSFAVASGTGGRFWSIGTAGVARMKIAEFSAKVQESREIPVNGRAVEAVRLRVAPTGMRSLLWHGDYWLRKSDGRYLKYVGRRGLFAGQLVKELVSED